MIICKWDRGSWGGGVLPLKKKKCKTRRFISQKQNWTWTFIRLESIDMEFFKFSDPSLPVEITIFWWSKWKISISSKAQHIMDNVNYRVYEFVGVSRICKDLFAFIVCISSMWVEQLFSDIIRTRARLLYDIARDCSAIVTRLSGWGFKYSQEITAIIMWWHPGQGITDRLTDKMCKQQL